MIAELTIPTGRRAELQLKGAGPTPYSRGSDGRAVLRSSIREYLCSEAMHALGIPTTRCLSLVASPQPVYREVQETAAVVCRIAPSFIRFGHFEYFRNNGKPEFLAPLADHLIAEQFPECGDAPDRHIRWLTEVVERTARLMAQWQTFGFCHGVMNTDNFSALGLTIDYGPFGFMDQFRHHHICNHSDHEGRYAYSAQPEIGQWNCSRLLSAALPLIAPEEAEAVERGTEIFQRYADVFNETAPLMWNQKLGLTELRAGDTELVNGFLTMLHRNRADFTRSFRYLARISSVSDERPLDAPEDLALAPEWSAWLHGYRARLRQEVNADDAARAQRMNAINPKFVLRNHLAQIAIERASAGDPTEIATLFDLLRRPYDEQPEFEDYAAPPPKCAPCVEVSCSS